MKNGSLVKYRFRLYFVFDAPSQNQGNKKVPFAVWVSKECPASQQRLKCFDIALDLASVLPFFSLSLSSLNKEKLKNKHRSGFMGSLGNNCGHYENHKMAILQPIVSFTYFYFAKYHTFYGLKPCKVLTGLTFDENVDDYSIFWVFEYYPSILGIDKSTLLRVLHI